MLKLPLIIHLRNKKVTIDYVITIHGVRQDCLNVGLSNNISRKMEINHLHDIQTQTNIDMYIRYDTTKNLRDEPMRQGKSI